MKWLENFDLFLFDLDGLLVNTEWLHYEAYKKMLLQRGYDIGIDFNRYFQFAQQDAHALKRFVYENFPKLHAEESDWQVLYKEKKKAVLDILDHTTIPLMPGVDRLLESLSKTEKKRCVVTHSAKEIVTRLRSHQPLLSVIDHWITREDYTNPKPAPDGYRIAIERLGEPSDRIIGFEDSERGMRSLLQTKATPVFINSIDPETRKRFENEGVNTYSSFDELFVKDLY